MPTITRQQLADALLEAGVERLDEAVRLLDATLEAIKETLASGEDVLVSGFGKFRVREKKARKGRNPKTGEDILVAPRRVVTYHAAPVLSRRCKAVLHPQGKSDEKP